MKGRRADETRCVCCKKSALLWRSGDRGRDRDRGRVEQNKILDRRKETREREAGR